MPDKYLGFLPCCTDRAKKKEDLEMRAHLISRAKCELPVVAPARAMNAAGGTASFYQLPVHSDNPIEGGAWIAKDLAHAFDELEFYEDARSLRGKPGWRLLDHMVGYGGILQEFEVVSSKGDTDVQDLLVMRDMLENMTMPRLLDLKIGAKTSAANWKGKSRARSLKQALFDACTNSDKEGVRLEGFKNPPRWIESEDPLLDLGGWTSWSSKSHKKAKRFAFQRMTMAEVFIAFADMQSVRANPVTPSASLLSAGEYAEVVVLGCLQDLGSIFRACTEVPLPQKWIGSSLAMIVEAGKALPRQALGQPVQPRALRVHIFDWGRSELNMPERHKVLSEEERKDREQFWVHYVSGVGRVLWEAARFYWNSFCVTKWGTLTVTIYDYDSQTDNDFLGAATVALPAVDGQPTKAKTGDSFGALDASETLPLLNIHGERVIGEDGQPAEVEVGYTYVEYPKPSRFRGAWRVVIESAAHLPAGDWSFKSGRTSDAFAVVKLLENSATAVAGRPRCSQGRTTVIPTSLDPAWHEEMEFPIACPAAHGAEATNVAGAVALGEVLHSSRGPWDDAGLAAVLPIQEVFGSEHTEDEAAEHALRSFLERLHPEPTPSGAAGGH